MEVSRQLEGEVMPNRADCDQDICKNQAGRIASTAGLCADKDTGYGEAAVKLQRDWKLDPQSLPLAKHIKGGALIRLIKYGLRYYYTQQTWDSVSSFSVFIG